MSCLRNREMGDEQGRVTSKRRLREDFLGSVCSCEGRHGEPRTSKGKACACVHMCLCTHVHVCTHLCTYSTTALERGHPHLC